MDEVFIKTLAPLNVNQCQNEQLEMSNEMKFLYNIDYQVDLVDPTKNPTVYIENSFATSKDTLPKIYQRKWH